MLVLRLTLIVFPNELFEKVYFEKSQMTTKVEKKYSMEKTFVEFSCQENALLK